MSEQRLGNTVHAWLSVASHSMSPEQISEAVGMPYDRCVRKGQKKPRTGVPYDHNGWSLETVIGTSGDKETEMAIQDSIRKVLERALPKADKFRSLAQEHTVDFHLGIVSAHMPTLIFDPQTIQAINALGAGLDIDVILFGDDE